MADKPKQGVQENFGDLLKSIWHYVINLVDVREDTDKRGTIESIKKYIVIKGYNVWILIAAAVIASIGLDNNSPAIIIGAMLISPLMSPILGIGLSIGINDRKMLWLAIQNFVVAIVVSILFSFLYFLITPLGHPTAELLARTQPTFLDVLVAFFGGIAGIVAGSHKDKTNALPGVAIATALMPPLCTAGFGLAKGNAAIWGGALYLFFINAVIISFTTYVFVRLLKFPLKQHVNPADKRKTNLFIGLFVVTVTIPSILILLNTLEKLAVNANARMFVENYIENNKTLEVLSWEHNNLDSLAELKVFIVGESIQEDSIPILEKDMQIRYPNLKTTRLNLVQMNVSKEEKDRLASEITDEVKQIIEVNQKFKEEQAQKIAELQNQVNNLKTDSLPLAEMNKEIKAIFPEIKALTCGNMLAYTNDSIPISYRIPNLSLKWDSTLTEKDLAIFEERIYNFAKVRYGFDTIRIRREN